MSRQALRTCPLCRTTTHFITPSSVWPSTAEEKSRIINGRRPRAQSAQHVPTIARTTHCPPPQHALHRARPHQAAVDLLLFLGALQATRPSSPPSTAGTSTGETGPARLGHRASTGCARHLPPPPPLSQSALIATSFHMTNSQWNARLCRGSSDIVITNIISPKNLLVKPVPCYIASCHRHADMTPEVVYPAHGFRWPMSHGKLTLMMCRHMHPHM